MATPSVKVAASRCSLKAFWTPRSRPRSPPACPGQPSREPPASPDGRAWHCEPMDRAALTSRRWDCVVVGGGHNGLAAAAYLAGAGRSVVVIERRAQVGGACTLERP